MTRLSLGRLGAGAAQAASPDMEITEIILAGNLNILAGYLEIILAGNLRDSVSCRVTVEVFLC
jgi:hypothetical protein